MIIEDFSVETVEVAGHPIQTFKNRFRTIWEMFSRCAATFENEIFLIEGQTRLTFRQTAELAACMAARLEKVGAAKGDHVGILMENSLRFVISFWAIQKLGATSVVFNTRLAPAELERQLRFSDLKILLTSPLLSPKLQEIDSASLAFRQIVLGDNWQDELPKRDGAHSQDGIAEDDTALVLFTSGTAGTPKGVMITHRNIITSALKAMHITSQYSGLEESGAQTMLMVAPLFHVLALQEQLMSALILGRSCILVPSFNPWEVVELLSRERVNVLAGTPTMYWLLLNKTPVRDAKLDSVRIITYGGAPMPPDLLKQIRESFPGVICLNGYGLTEASVISTLHDRFSEVHPTSVGQPNLCSEVRIVDLLDGKELGPNAVGELAVRGALVSKGYYKLPEETARVYRDGWFHTGDMAYRDEDGFLFIVGRTREMINRGGENVYPVEVENVLHLHPKILDVAVFGLPDPVMGSAVACAVILRPDVETIGVDEIREFCAGHLADYKMPRKVFLVPDLPRNPGGKIMKSKLVEQFRETASPDKQ
ncbi:MAG: long-chain fatty acid--CoA ligase [Candidatus Abyssobacteria bacterium SURF_5]|uniref:Long-chain fatty acid--CoA ligase n=1 Tax=Abyssobacteria bacterium (strain SURF_5) TaxID=2093360 RepID=A0A3A4P1R9_ABYX5|nr:MAG: long-chain fatty acid--CoA ligase [Candidatus Abyssubacteria bacterium SURF_5]